MWIFEGRHRYDGVFAVVDRLTKRPKTITAREMAHYLSPMCAYGGGKRLVLDRGAQFTLES